METWREMIYSKSYGTHSQMLADEIATLARHLVADTTPHEYISTFLAYRLVPFMAIRGEGGGVKAPLDFEIFSKKRILS